MDCRRAPPQPWQIIGIILLLFLLSACAAGDPATCRPQPPADIKNMPPYSGVVDVPFRFPLDDLSTSQRLPSARFQVSGMETPTRREFHAAEDFLSPPGTPVYAIADGRVSYSGPRKGYGWLVIVDHPQANLYSLYGHLSPSRWQIDEIPVQQGDLLGYLGDPDENGGSAEQPLRPHLHLGLRTGQRSDYPTSGEWRWMAGWITPCPTDVGWQHPSAIMTAQQIPANGFTNPSGALLVMWGVDLGLAAVYAIGGVYVFIYGFRRDKTYVFFSYAFLTLVAGIVLANKQFRITPLLFAIAAISLAIGLYRIVLRARKTPAG